MVCNIRAKYGTHTHTHRLMGTHRLMAVTKQQERWSDDLFIYTNVQCYIITLQPHSEFSSQHNKHQCYFSNSDLRV